MTSCTYKMAEKCTRCPREEHFTVSFEEILKAAKSENQQPLRPPSLVVQIDGQTLIDFPYLCAACRDIVLSHLNQVALKPSHRSSKRVVVNRGKKKEEQAPPSTPKVSQAPQSLPRK